MYYVIEGVRWGADGRITHVRWHPVQLDGGEVRHGPRELVAVVDAARACNEGEVRVYVDGPAGQYFKMKACAEGIEAEEEMAGPSLEERLAHLPAA